MEFSQHTYEHLSAELNDYLEEYLKKLDRSKELLVKSQKFEEAQKLNLLTKDIQEWNRKLRHLNFSI